MPWHPPSTLGQTTRNSVGVDRLAGADDARPTSRASDGQDRPSPAACESPVRACRTSTALDRRRVERPPRLVGDRHLSRDGRRPRARSHHPASERRELSSSGFVPRTPERRTKRWSRSVGRPEACLEVGQDVVNRLDTHRETHEVRAHAGRGLFGLGQLRVGRRGRVDGQAAHVAHVREVAEQFQALDEAPTRVDAPLDAEGHDGPATLGRYFC